MQLKTVFIKLKFLRGSLQSFVLSAGSKDHSAKISD